MGTVTILPETTMKPISLIGERAGVCWGADTSNAEKNFRRGWDCLMRGHGRTLEFVNVEMILDGYSARVIREWYTHIGGAPTRLQASTRYIDYGDFEYVTPPSIDGNPAAKAKYDATMAVISDTLRRLEADGLPREDIAMLLPLGMTTRIVCKHNLRNLIDMSHQRLCSRAFWEYRVLMHDIMYALRQRSPEWRRVIDNWFEPKCDLTGYCTEKQGCGRNPALGGK